MLQSILNKSMPQASRNIVSNLFLPLFFKSEYNSCI